MRFFSNEAKDNADEQENTGTAVPQQRAGSPWQHSRTDSHSDSRTDSSPTDSSRTDSRTDGTDPSTVVAAAPVRPADDDPDRTTPLTDADRTAAFSDPDRTGAFPDAGRVGGSSDPDRTTPLSDADRTAAFSDSGRTASFEDGTRSFEDGTRGDGTRRAEPVQVNPAPAADRDGDGKIDNDEKVDLALDDRGTFDDPHVSRSGRTGTEPSHADKDGDGIPDVSDRSVTSDKSGLPDGRTDVVTDRDDTSPAKGESSADETFTDGPFATPDKSDTTADAVDEDEPLVPPAPATETTISGPAPFFPAADTQPLRDRWRDVQLRFVDDPKGATADASGLVDEAVDKLAAALRDHRGSFAKGSEDTEVLRLEFRNYRDILDRLLGL